MALTIILSSQKSSIIGVWQVLNFPVLFAVGLTDAMVLILSVWENSLLFNLLVSGAYLKLTST